MEARPTIVEAVVVAGVMETWYRRAGHGPPVLLLTDDRAAFDALAGRCRVLQPNPSPGAVGSAEWVAWLKGLVDGLGLCRPAVVVPEDLMAAVVDVAVGDPDRFGPVTVVAPVATLPSRLLSALEVIDT
jgi:hypothetical protein